MDANESRLMLLIPACIFAFSAGIIGFAFTSEQVKDRVDRRVAQQVDRRVCQLMPTACPPPSAARTSTRGD
jgi:hypothetical protein